MVVSMKKTDVIKHYGSQRKVACELGISEQAVSLWGEIIPEKNALRLHQMTNGVLEYKETMYRQDHKLAS